MKFSGVITSDKSDVHANCKGQRSKVNVTEVKTEFVGFRTVAQIDIRRWLRDNKKNPQIWPSLSVSGL